MLKTLVPGRFAPRPKREAVPPSGTAQSAAVSLVGVGKTFRTSRGSQVEALRDISLSIREGEFICVIGTSGCGKSTLLRLIAGFEQATSGKVMVRGKQVNAPGPDRGVVFQDYGLFPWLTIAENIAYGPRQRGLPKDEVRAIVRRFIGLVRLSRFADKYPHELSGGMQQRVAIARVLANDPAVLLMDEPFGALDSLTRQTMQEELRGICQELKPTTLFITHSVEEAVFLADRVVVMAGGPSHGMPGHIKAISLVPMAHPRDVTSPDFNELKRELLTAIHGDAAEARYLVVANQTALSSELVEHLRELAGENPKARFTLLVPATDPSKFAVRSDGLAQVVAQQRADEARRLFENADLKVAGTVVGEDSPTRAIRRELRARPGDYDEIILCTLPPGMSKWMASGAHREIERRFDIPVTHVVATSARSPVVAPIDIGPGPTQSLNSHSDVPS